MTRIVVLLQENKTPDYYFPTMAAWGAEIENRGHLRPAPPMPDPKHDRNAWVHFKMGDYRAAMVQIDSDIVIPYYSWLAKQFTFCDHHFGLGTNSTSGHMFVVGGQTPTLKNPPPSSVWDRTRHRG
jgi:phospholipase C